MPTKAVGEPPKVKFCNELMIYTWNDACKTKSVKIVSMSTKHTGELVDTGKTHFQTKQNILKLDVIREYTATMGGVDNLSRIIDPYNIQRKGRKWYRKLAKLFIEIAVHKSFILWKKTNNPNIDKNSVPTRYNQQHCNVPHDKTSNTSDQSKSRSKWIT